MKKNRKNLEAEAIDLVRKWAPKIFLDEWRIHVSFPKSQLKWEHGITNCDIQVCTTYLEARMRVFPSWFHAKPEERELMIVHELCHIHTQELADQVIALKDGRLVTESQYRHAHERLTQRLAYIAMRKP